MYSHSNLCWANSDTVYFGIVLRKGEISFDHIHIQTHKHKHTNRYIMACLSSVLTVWFHLSILQTEGTSGSVGVCVCVCVCVSLLVGRKQRQTLLPWLKSWKKQTSWFWFHLSWITEHYLNMRQDRHTACDQTLGSWLQAEQCLLHAGNAQCFSGFSFVLVQLLSPV